MINNSLNNRFLFQITKKIFSLLVIFIFSISYLNSEINSAKEAHLVIAYIERCTRFVEWPENSGIQNKDQPFKLCIYKSNPFDNEIFKSFQNQKIKEKKVEICIINKLSELKDCNLLFVPSSKDIELEEVIRYCQKSSILTFSYSHGFAAKGININFYLENKNLKFEINTNSVKKSDLKISHLLLDRAKIVN